MGSLTIARSITGDVNNVDRDFTIPRTTTPITRGYVRQVSITNAWKEVWEYNADMASLSNDMNIVLVNRGDEDAFYRVTNSGPAYRYFNLHAGGHVEIHINEGGEYAGAAATSIALYSANGTEIELGVFW